MTCASIPRARADISIKSPIKAAINCVSRLQPLSASTSPKAQCKATKVSSPFPFVPSRYYRRCSVLCTTYDHFLTILHLVEMTQSQSNPLILSADDLAIAFDSSSIISPAANSSSLAAHQSHRADVIKLRVLISRSLASSSSQSLSHNGPATAPPFVLDLSHTSSPAISIHLRAARKECKEYIPSTVLASHSSEPARTREAN
jgi:hypothetical protein